VAQIDKIYNFKVSIACISERGLTVFQRGALYKKMRRDSNLLKFSILQKEMILALVKHMQNNCYILYFKKATWKIRLRDLG